MTQSKKSRMDKTSVSVFTDQSKENQHVKKLLTSFKKSIFFSSAFPTWIRLIRSSAHRRSVLGRHLWPTEGETRFASFRLSLRFSFISFIFIIRKTQERGSSSSTNMAYLLRIEWFPALMAESVGVTWKLARVFKNTKDCKLQMFITTRFSSWHICFSYFSLWRESLNVFYY